MRLDRDGSAAVRPSRASPNSTFASPEAPVILGSKRTCDVAAGTDAGQAPGAVAPGPKPTLKGALVAAVQLPRRGHSGHRAAWLGSPRTAVRDGANLV
ncbi:hypothetical protein CSE45_4420 [Citreicella sp. SE45]|nr:hypothetical protein CSE45_4420 [Citreicella sp. SE45]